MTGSIPAHAGEPLPRLRATTCSWVYPRPRGGTSASASSRATWSGLSPPTRGSRYRTLNVKRHRRSIPAHAGEPTSRSDIPPMWGVYPRPRGGATLEKNADFHVEGLSPPTRGSRRHSVGRIFEPRSIPAHAGEPGHLRSPRRLHEVYPRPRGGAKRLLQEYVGVQGLSPPTRGSR